MQSNHGLCQWPPDPHNPSPSGATRGGRCGSNRVFVPGDALVLILNRLCSSKYLSSLPQLFLHLLYRESEAEESTELTPSQQRFVASPHFGEVRNIVQGRCAMCHASVTAWDGIVKAPKGVKLETDRQIAAHARAIYLQAGHTRAMPPANVSFMEDDERRLIIEWYNSVVGLGFAAILD